MTTTKEVIKSLSTATETGILIGFWDADEYEASAGKAFSSLTPMGPLQR